MRETVIGLSPDRFAICPGAPVCGSLRLALQRQGDHLLHLLVRNLARRDRVGAHRNNPSIPRAMNRDRHFPTVRGDTLSLAATTLLSRPRAQLSTIADRTAQTLRRCCDADDTPARISRSTSVSSSTAFGRHSFSHIRSQTQFGTFMQLTSGDRDTRLPITSGLTVARGRTNDPRASLPRGRLRDGTHDHRMKDEDATDCTPVQCRAEGIGQI